MLFRGFFRQERSPPVLCEKKNLPTTNGGIGGKPFPPLFWKVLHFDKRKISPIRARNDFLYQTLLKMDQKAETSEILVSREFSRIFFLFHFSFSISSHFNFTFTSRKRVKGFYFSLFTSRKK